MERLREVLSWSRDPAGTHDPEAVRIRRQYLVDCTAREVAVMANCVREARDGRLGLAREFAWPIVGSLEMVNEAFVTSHPLDLMDLADKAGDDPLVAQQRFEALCLVDLASAMFELERVDPFARVEDDLSSMIQLFERRIFLSGTRELTVFTYHDPNDFYRVMFSTFGTARTDFPFDVRKHSSRCRVTNHNVVTRFDVRPKGTFGTVLKLIRQTSQPRDGRDPCQVRDRCAFKFVVMDVAQAKILVSQLVWHLVAMGADVQCGGDNLTVETGASADVGNRHSSSKYRKKQLDVLWRGRWFEIQIVLFSGYYGARYCLDEENHAIYKLRQGVSDVLPMLFPPDIYLRGIPWTSPEIHDLLRERQLENLGWNLRRNKE